MSDQDPNKQAQEEFAAMRAAIGGIGESAMRLLFTEARTVNGWLDREVSEGQIREVFDLMKMAPTSANVSPARLTVVRSPEGKERLRPALSGGNLDKTMAAPATFIVAYDLDFAQRLDFLFPHDAGAAGWFAGEEITLETAFRNGTLQGAYLIMAARAVGLDCGPMSGFDNAVVDEAFYAGTRVKSNFLCNVGYGDPASIFARSPRFAFDDVCEIV